LASAGAGLPPLKSAVDYTPEGEAWGSGCCIACVEVDLETGAIEIDKIVWVDDAGAVVNPALVRGQLWGGLMQGLGEALKERLVYDEAGQLTTASFMDYAMPRATDVPSVDFRETETPSVYNVLGAKGVGEAGCIGIPAAVVNAVIDALSPFGVKELDMPLTSANVWRSLQRVNQAKINATRSKK
jgi:carbon-monoxide dehydrogenase large subunit